MNTTVESKPSFFASREDYLNFINFWKQKANSKNATFRDHLIYTILRNRPLSKCYTPVSNKTKLACNYGNNPFLTLKIAIIHLQASIEYGGRKWDGVNKIWLEDDNSKWGEWAFLTPETREKLKAYILIAMKDCDVEKFYHGNQ